MEIFTPPDVKPKKPPGRVPRHSPEYRLMIAKKVVEEGMSYRDAADAFGLSHGAIGGIVKNYKHEGTKSMLAYLRTLTSGLVTWLPD